MLVAGLIFITVGAVTAPLASAIPWLGWIAPAGKPLASIGGAILGGGVFAVIMKSAQFTGLFQKHIYDVFYDPANVLAVDDLRQKWLHITQAILKSVLPIAHQDAAHRIMEQFLDAELQYHFTSYETKYDITVDEASQVARIIHTTKFTLVISPNHPSPVFTQEITAQEDDDCRLLSLFINGKRIDLDNAPLREVEGPKKSWVFELELGKFAKAGDGSTDRTLSIERTYEVTQDVRKSPELIGTIKRYTRGLVVKARIANSNGSADHYGFYFSRTGLLDGIEIKAPEPQVDGEGFQRWVIGGPDDLLLPGQGYILLIRKNEAEVHA